MSRNGDSIVAEPSYSHLRRLQSHRVGAEILAELDTEGEAADIAYDGNLVVIAVRERGILFVDIATSNPTQKSLFEANAQAVVLDRDRKLVYAACSYEGIKILSYNNPTQTPVLVGNLPFSFPLRAVDLALRENDLYVAADSALMRVNVTNAALPNIVSQNPILASNMVLSEDKNTLYTLGGGIKVFNVTGGSPIAKSTYIPPEIFFVGGRMVSVGTHLYLPAAFPPAGNPKPGFQVVNAQNSSNLVHVASYQSPSLGFAHALLPAGGRLILGTDKGVEFFNIEDLSDIRPSGSIELPGPCYAMNIKGLNLLAADGSGGFLMMEKHRINPQRKLNIALPGRSQRTSVVENMVLSWDNFNGVIDVVDISSPASPIYKGSSDPYLDNFMDTLLPLYDVGASNLALGITDSAVKTFKLDDGNFLEQDSFLTSDNPHAAVQRNNSVVVTTDNGILVFQVNNSRLNLTANCLSCPPYGEKIVNFGDYAFVSDGSSIFTVDFKNSSAPIWSSSFDLGSVRDFAVVGQNLYVVNLAGYSAGWWTNLHQIAIGNQGVLSLKESFPKLISGVVGSIKPVGNKYFSVASSGKFFSVFDSGSPSGGAPDLAGSLAFSAGDELNGHVVRGREAFVSMGPAGLVAIDKILPNEDPILFFPVLFKAHKGEAGIVTTDYLGVIAPDSKDSELEWEVSSVTRGYFYRLSNPSEAITRFKHSEVKAHQIGWKHDGSNVPFAFKVRINDGYGFVPTNPVTVPVNFISTPPVFVKNDISLPQGQTVIVTTNNIRAETAGVADPNIELPFETNEHCQFERSDRPGIKIASSPQGELDPQTSAIRLAHDNSEFPCSFNVTAKIGSLTSAKQIGNITNINRPDPPRFASKSKFNVVGGAKNQILTTDNVNVVKTDRVSGRVKLTYIASNIEFRDKITGEILTELDPAQIPTPDRASEGRIIYNLLGGRAPTVIFTATDLGNGKSAQDTADINFIPGAPTLVPAKPRVDMPALSTHVLDERELGAEGGSIDPDLLTFDVQCDPGTDLVNYPQGQVLTRRPTLLEVKLGLVALAHTGGIPNCTVSVGDGRLSSPIEKLLIVLGPAAAIAASESNPLVSALSVLGVTTVLGTALTLARHFSIKRFEKTVDKILDLRQKKKATQEERDDYIIVRSFVNKIFGIITTSSFFGLCRDDQLTEDYIAAVEDLVSYLGRRIVLNRDDTDQINVLSNLVIETMKKNSVLNPRRTCCSWDWWCNLCSMCAGIFCPAVSAEVLKDEFQKNIGKTIINTLTKPTSPNYSRYKGYGFVVKNNSVPLARGLSSTVMGTQDLEKEMKSVGPESPLQSIVVETPKPEPSREVGQRKAVKSGRSESNLASAISMSRLPAADKAAAPDPSESKRSAAGLGMQPAA